jgi:transposase-like protein
MDDILHNPILQDDTKAREWLEARVWPNGPVCPHCGATSEHTTGLHGQAHRAGAYQCNACREQFTVTVGTVFERSKLPLSKWLAALFLMTASKKGISAHQIHRMLGISYKSAWFMCHRLREAMRPAKYPRPLGGLEETVEADETFIGGKAANRKSRKVRAKQAVVVLVQRGADARSFPIRKINSRHMNALLDKQVSKKSYLMTDESRVYSRLGKKFRDHETVNHSIEEYVRGDAHVNNAENYFSILKRGIYGVYHHVSHEHLPMYLAEFDFRYNARAGLGVNDYERAELAAKGIVGKRLTLRRPRVEGQESTT